LLTNLVALPGLGSWLAGRRVTGTLQMALSLPGFGLSLLWFGTFVHEWWGRRAFPWDGGAHLRWGVLGVLLFTAGWLWGLATGYAVLRKAKP
jgi:hypothetical protein